MKGSLSKRPEGSSASVRSLGDALASHALPKEMSRGSETSSDEKREKDLRRSTLDLLVEGHKVRTLLGWRRDATFLQFRDGRKEEACVFGKRTHGR